MEDREFRLVPTGPVRNLEGAIAEAEERTPESLGDSVHRI